MGIYNSVQKISNTHIKEGGVNLKVAVDQDLCISCGLCISICDQVFHWNEDDKAEAIDGDVPEELEADVQEAMDSCPTGAIKEV